MSNWFYKIIRIAGAGFPVSSSLVQYHAELQSAKTDIRLAKIEDPISFFHDDISQFSKLVYTELKNQDSWKLNFDEGFYQRYKRCMAVLEKARLIKLIKGLGQTIPECVNITDATYFYYIFATSMRKNIRWLRYLI